MAKRHGLISEIRSHLGRLEEEAGFRLGETTRTELLRMAGELSEIPTRDEPAHRFSQGDALRPLHVLRFTAYWPISVKRNA